MATPNTVTLSNAKGLPAKPVREAPQGMGVDVLRMGILPYGQDDDIARTIRQ